MLLPPNTLGCGGRHCLAHNTFHELQKVILDFDPSLTRVDTYVEVLKEFLRSRRVLDLLYSYQARAGANPALHSGTGCNSDGTDACSRSGVDF